jgi:hypothetical protein
VTAARKTWSTSAAREGVRTRRASKAETYRWVQGQAAKFHRGQLPPWQTEVFVWVDEGSGRDDLYETVSLADLPGATS